nr:MAG TPA: hypothetical protein [Caudoviricetes sp.]
MILIAYLIIVLDILIYNIFSHFVLYIFFKTF